MRSPNSFDKKLIDYAEKLLSQYAKLKKDEMSIVGSYSYDPYFPDPSNSLSKVEVTTVSASIKNLQSPHQDEKKELKNENKDNQEQSVASTKKLQPVQQEEDHSIYEQTDENKAAIKMKSPQEVKEANDLLFRLTAKMIVVRNAISAIREFQQSEKILKDYEKLATGIADAERVSHKIPHSSKRAGVAKFFGISVTSATTDTITDLHNLVKNELSTKPKFSPGKT